MKRRTWKWAGVLVGVGLLAWLASMGVGRIGGRLLALPDDASLADLGPPPAEDAADTPRPEADTRTVLSPSSSAGTKRTYVDPILRRNIFDSANVGMAGGSAENAGTDRRSDLKVVLLATVVADPVEYSSALIAEEKGSTGALGYGIGDDLLGEATILRIEPRRVVVRRNDGSVEYIAMEEGKTFQKDAADMGKAGEEDTEDDGVTKAGENKFVVDQALVDQFLENPEKLYSKVRAVPHKGTDGEIDGYRLSGIRRNSVFSKLGIKNGDIVHAANGKGLTSMSNAMDAYSSLQNEKNFSFEITRRGQRQTFDYEIR